MFDFKNTYSKLMQNSILNKHKKFINDLDQLYDNKDAMENYIIEYCKNNNLNFEFSYDSAYSYFIEISYKNISKIETFYDYTQNREYLFFNSTHGTLEVDKSTILYDIHRFKNMVYIESDPNSASTLFDIENFFLEYEHFEFIINNIKLEESEIFSLLSLKYDIDFLTIDMFPEIIKITKEFYEAIIKESALQKF